MTTKPLVGSAPTHLIDSVKETSRLTGQEWHRLRDLVEQDLTMVTHQIVNIQKTPDIHEPQDLVAHQEEAVALQTLLAKLDDAVTRIPA